MAPDCVQVTTTIDSESAAERLARGMVEARMVACVQVVGPVRSVYRWHGAVQLETEWQLVAKTTAARVEVLTEYLRAEHAYDVPEVVVTAIVGGSDDYLSWVAEQV